MVETPWYGAQKELDAGKGGGISLKLLPSTLDLTSPLDSALPNLLRLGLRPKPRKIKRPFGILADGR